MDPYRVATAKLEPLGQAHLLRWWPELDPAEKHKLLRDVQALDFDRLAPLIAGDADADGHESPQQRAARARPPAELVRLPASGGDPREWTRAREFGEQLLRDGKVGAILVAGGQGTRLGFDRPKGMFPIGPVSGKMLFQILCEQLAARGRRAGQAIPYYIMTSSATHDQTRQCFEEQQFFGLDPDQVSFFQQGSLPAVDDHGRILMEAKSGITSSPDGHGGLLHALWQAGLHTLMADRGIEYLYYHQVDNPAAIVCDPAFIGLHALHGSEMSTKVVAKKSAAERMGVVVSVDGGTEIIEYSDLPPERAAATDRNGQLLLWAGSTAMHVFNREFIHGLIADGCKLPYHRAHKAVPHIDESGERVNPEEPNAWKFEQFIFDALPFAKRALVVEADRAREFLPVKNRDGADSPATVRDALLKLYAEWLATTKARVEPSARVEISPLYALDAEELAAKLPSIARFDSDAYVE